MKEKPLFNFQPFEIDGEFDGKPHAFTKAFWQGQEREFALALVDGWLRFCEVDKLESGEWNFAVRESVEVTSDSLEIDSAFLENAFHSALEKEEVGRLLCIVPTPLREYDNKVPQFVFIGVDNKGFLQIRREPSAFNSFSSRIAKSPFYEPTSLSVTGDTITKWYAEVQNWLVDAESDFSFSCRWNQLHDYEKSKLVTVLKNGNDVKMKEISNLIVRLDENLFVRPRGVSGVTIAVHFKLAKLEKPAVLKSVFIFYAWSGMDIQQQPPLGLWEVFLRYFEPRLNPKLREKYTVLKSFDDYLGHVMTITEHLRLNAHERLEVRLKLAEWLQGKVPDEQIDLLLA